MTFDVITFSFVIYLFFVHISYVSFIIFSVSSSNGLSRIQDGSNSILNCVSSFPSIILKVSFRVCLCIDLNWSPLLLSRISTGNFRMSFFRFLSIFYALAMIALHVFEVFYFLKFVSVSECLFAKIFLLSDVHFLKYFEIMRGSYKIFFHISFCYVSIKFIGVI